MKNKTVKRVKKPRWPDYEVVKIPEGVVTFGTTLFMRKDGIALRVVFPAGHYVTFAPAENIMPKFSYQIKVCLRRQAPRGKRTK